MRTVAAGSPLSVALWWEPARLSEWREGSGADTQLHAAASSQTWARKPTGGFPDPSLRARSAPTGHG